MTSLVEDITPNDGEYAHITKMRVYLRLYSLNLTSPYLACPVVVQTAGTFTDTVDQNLNPPTYYMSLDGAISDEFGFQKLQEAKASGIINITDDGGNELHQTMNFILNIPQNVIRLLNKEANTERLQDVYLGLVGIAIASTASFAYNLIIETEYVLKSKGITIR